MPLFDNGTASITKIRSWLRTLTFLDVILIGSAYIPARFLGSETLLITLSLWLLFVGVLVLQRCRYSWIGWLAIAALILYDAASGWYITDNHEWLFGLWALTIALTLRFSGIDDRKMALESNARWLLVLVMLYAVLQKALDPTFLSGEFFTYTFLTDDRFVPWTKLVGGLGEAEVASNYESFYSLFGSEATMQIQLASNYVITLIGKLTTWWLWGIELLIGILFIFKQRTLELWGHLLMVFFVAVTYTIAPVYGFGLLLTAAAALLAHDRFPRILRCYLAVAVYLLVLDSLWLLFAVEPVHAVWLLTALW